MVKLNMGCGRDIKVGYVNMDSAKLAGVDIIHDLDKFPWPFKDNYFEEVFASHVLEHLNDKIKPLEEIYRVCKNNAKVIIKVPIFPGTYAVCDPTHKQFFNYSTFDYFRPNNQGLNYYSKAKFEIIKRKIIFHPALKPMEAINISSFTQKFWAAFLSFILPAVILEVELRVIK